MAQITLRGIAGLGKGNVNSVDLNCELFMEVALDPGSLF